MPVRLRCSPVGIRIERAIGTPPLPRTRCSSPSDGPFIIATGNDRQWRRLCEVIGADELLDDPRFVTNGGRVAHISELGEAMAPHLLERSAAEWISALLEARVPAGPINTLTEAFADARTARSRSDLDRRRHAHASGPDQAGPAPRWRRGRSRRGSGRTPTT